MYLCTYVPMYVCTYIRDDIDPIDPTALIGPFILQCTYVRMYVCTYVPMYVCTYVRDEHGVLYTHVLRLEPLLQAIATADGFLPQSRDCGAVSHVILQRGTSECWKVLNVARRRSASPSTSPSSTATAI